MTAFSHNPAEAARQEFQLAYRHLIEVRKQLSYSNPDHVERYLDAQDRLNKARKLLCE